MPHTRKWERAKKRDAVKNNATEGFRSSISRWYPGPIYDDAITELDRKERLREQVSKRKERVYGNGQHNSDQD